MDWPYLIHTDDMALHRHVSHWFCQSTACMDSAVYHSCAARAAYVRGFWRARYCLFVLGIIERKIYIRKGGKYFLERGVKCAKDNLQWSIYSSLDSRLSL